MTSAESGQELMHAARDAGCGGFVAKCEAPSQFLSAVHTVLDGKLHFPMLDPEARPIPLSQRENQVYQALVQGKAIQDLAQELGVTYASVQTYMSRRSAAAPGAESSSDTRMYKNGDMEQE